MSIFKNIISPELKGLYKDAINELLSSSGLATKVKINYLRNINTANDCDNCVIDPIYKKSTGKYNGTGLMPFSDGSVCPVCNGDGYSTPNSEEYCYMAVLTSEKSWVDIGLDPVKIPAGSVQTIAVATLSQKIKNAYSITIVDHNGINNNLSYERDSDIIHLGFGGHDYAITMWKKMI
jgi:hypothetical protein